MQYNGYMSKYKEMCKYSSGGQWSLGKNVNQSYDKSQNTVQMSEKEMRSEVGTNRQQDVRVDKKDEEQRDDNLGSSVPMGKKDPSAEMPEAPQRADNIRADGGAIKSDDGYVHGLPPGHPNLGHHEGYTYRRTRPPIKNDMTWQFAVRNPAGQDSHVHLPESTGGSHDAIRTHISNSMKKYEMCKTSSHGQWSLITKLPK